MTRHVSMTYGWARERLVGVAWVQPRPVTIDYELPLGKNSPAVHVGKGPAVVHPPAPPGAKWYACAHPENDVGEGDGTAFWWLCRGCVLAAAATTYNHPTMVGEGYGPDDSRPVLHSMTQWVRDAWPAAFASTPLADRCPL